MLAAVAPGASSRWRRIPTVVVLPFVPVTPTKRSRSAGSSWKAAAATAAATRLSRTIIAGRSVPAASSAITSVAPAEATMGR